MYFNLLTGAIEQANSALQQSAFKAVNLHLTLRNWITGFFIVEYEQHGSDRAEYGKKLLDKLAKMISIKGLTAPKLSRCRQFYQVYPQFMHLFLPSGDETSNNRQQIPHSLHHLIFGTLSQKIQHVLPTGNFGTLSQKSEVSAQSINVQYFEKLLLSTPYSHFTELIKIEEMMPDDKPPVGILLVTYKNDALVKFATSGINNPLLISKYLLQLPTKAQLEDFIKKELKNL